MSKIFENWSWTKMATSVLWVVLFAVLVVFIGTMYFDCPKCVIALLGLDGVKLAKFQALEFMGVAMGGLIAALLAVAAYRRSKAMEDTILYDRMNIAVSHLGHKSDSVRFGAVYELFHLAKDIKELRDTVLDIICTHVRQITSEGQYQRRYQQKPSQEIQNTVRLIFIDHGNMFRRFHANLRGAWLNGIDLSKGQLEEAVLTEARLNGANLRETCLRGAYLTNTKLRGADMRETDMQGADLVSAKMQGTDLKNADMQGAYLGGARLQGAILKGACMQGATNRAISEDFKTRIKRQNCKITALANGQNGSTEDIEEDYKEVVFIGKLKYRDIDPIICWIKNDDLQQRVKNSLEKSLDRKNPRDNEGINNFLIGEGVKTGKFRRNS